MVPVGLLVRKTRRWVEMAESSLVFEGISSIHEM